MRNLVFLIDLDNTILDNDGVKKDMEARLLGIMGSELAVRFWELYEIVRNEIDVVDFIETFKRLRAEFPGRETIVDAGCDALVEWDFRPRLYPKSINTVLHLRSLGLPIVVSDGDPVYQPSKIHQCGVTMAVDGRVLIFVHKEKYLRTVETMFKARHYVLIDDKPGILMRSKAALGEKLTTIHVLQGKYALDPKHAVDYTPDIVAKNFSDLLGYGANEFVNLGQGAAKAVATS